MIERSERIIKITHEQPKKGNYQNKTNGKHKGRETTADVIQKRKELNLTTLKSYNDMLVCGATIS